ncbi:hypothetical protein [Sporosarcina ureae]|uniref:hypothetical protein n=1 Tax=Sporosarcina ureae TaxID=1571 RepID=UPI000401931E|nr:hypothetical protein [Sporosarcina ureae]
MANDQFGDCASFVEYGGSPPYYGLLVRVFIVARVLVIGKYWDKFNFGWIIGGEIGF